MNMQSLRDADTVQRLMQKHFPLHDNSQAGTVVGILHRKHLKRKGGRQ